jgi:hypothetical protein
MGLRIATHSSPHRSIILENTPYVSNMPNHGSVRSAASSFSVFITSFLNLSLSDTPPHDPAACNYRRSPLSQLANLGQLPNNDRLRLAGLRPRMTTEVPSQDALGHAVLLGGIVTLTAIVTSHAHDRRASRRTREFAVNVRERSAVLMRQVVIDLVVFESPDELKLVDRASRCASHLD